MQRFLDLFISINCSACFRRILRPSSGAQNCIYSVRYCQNNTAACCYRGWDGTEFHLIHDSSIIGLTIPDAVYTVLCSWWWAEERPETCRAIYRNKQIEKTLHLLGRTLEIHLWCTDMWTSKAVFLRSGIHVAVSRHSRTAKAINSSFILFPAFPYVNIQIYSLHHLTLTARKKKKKKKKKKNIYI